jgi:hypothetical protein
VRLVASFDKEPLDPYKRSDRKVPLNRLTIWNVVSTEKQEGDMMAALTITAFSQDIVATPDFLQLAVSLSDSTGQPVYIDVNSITAFVTETGTPLRVRGVGTIGRGFTLVALEPVVGSTPLSPGRQYTLALTIDFFEQDHCQTLVKVTIPREQELA